MRLSKLNRAWSKPRNRSRKTPSRRQWTHLRHIQMSAFPAAPCLPPRQISRIYLEEFKRTYSGVWRASARWPTLEQLFFIRVLGGPHRSAALPTSLGLVELLGGLGRGQKLDVKTTAGLGRRSMEL